MTSYSLPFNIQDIDFDNIVYKNIKSNSKKTVVFLKYRKKNSLKNLVIQTPSLLNINKATDSNSNYFDLEIPLLGKKTEKTDSFVNFLKKLDNKIIYDAKINSSSWFGGYDINEINYQEIIRNSEDKKYSNGFIRIKIIKNTEFQTMLQLNNVTQINATEIPINSWVKMILEVQAIWINKNGFGLFMKPILISFDPIEIKKYKFLEDSEDEVDEVIDSENSIFLSNNNQPESSSNETSILRINSIEDSLEIESKKRFSSTSSEGI